jgi:signal transduction histidine kinase
MTAVFHGLERPKAADEIDTIRALLHDLRQPLAAILLLSGTESGDVGRKMAGISSQAHWLAELVETVLRDGAGDDVARVDVGEIAAVAVRRAAPTAECKVRLELAGSTEAWARPVALGRALSCVLDNAIRAAGADGHVVVSVGADGPDMHIRVQDDGPGLGKIASRTSLGLTTTRAMVAACRGTFGLRQGPAGGAVADISLVRADLESVAS